ncbi:MAG TPA: flagellum-specific ATP synthase FliI, partial [Pseudomonas sp.]|nr:flagellum-specific ATP synthase FliI [Pseudomonas sp.]
YEKIKELIPLGGYSPGADIKTDRAVQLAPTIERFLRQEVGEAAELETSLTIL